MSVNALKIKGLKPIADHVVVSEMNFSERITRSGIIIPGDDAKTSGIRPRWARVYAVGPDCKDVKVGQYVLVEHGRWTRGVKINDGSGEDVFIRRADPNDILLVSDEEWVDENMAGSDVVHSQRNPNAV